MPVQSPDRIPTSRRPGDSVTLVATTSSPLLLDLARTGPRGRGDGAVHEPIADDARAGRERGLRDRRCQGIVGVHDGVLAVALLGVLVAAREA